MRLQILTNSSAALAFLGFAKNKLRILAQLREDSKRIEMHKTYVFAREGVSIFIKTSDFGDTIRISGGSFPSCICAMRQADMYGFTVPDSSVIEVNKKKRWELSVDQTHEGPFVDYRRNKDVYTWRGPDSRYFGFTIYGSDIWRNTVYLNRAIHSYSPTIDGYATKIHGVGVRSVDGVKWLVIVASDKAGVNIYRRPNTMSYSTAMYDVDTNPDGWIEVGNIPYLNFTYSSPTGSTIVFPWLFSPDGSKAVSVNTINFIGTIRGVEKNEVVTVSEMLTFDDLLDPWAFKLLFLDKNKEYVELSAFVPSHLVVTANDDVSTDYVDGATIITTVRDQTAEYTVFGPVDFMPSGQISIAETTNKYILTKTHIYNFSFSYVVSNVESLTTIQQGTVCGVDTHNTTTTTSNYYFGYIEESIGDVFVSNATTNKDSISPVVYDIRDSFVCLLEEASEHYSEDYIKWFGEGYNRFLKNSRSSDNKVLNFKVKSKLEGSYDKYLSPVVILLPPRKELIEEEGWLEFQPATPSSNGLELLDSTIYGANYLRKVSSLVSNYWSSTGCFSRHGLYVFSVFLPSVADVDQFQFRSYPANAFEIVPFPEEAGVDPHYKWVGPA